MTCVLLEVKTFSYTSCNPSLLLHEFMFCVSCPGINLSAGPFFQILIFKRTVLFHEGCERPDLQILVVVLRAVTYCGTQMLEQPTVVCC